MGVEHGIACELSFGRGAMGEGTHMAPGGRLVSRVNATGRLTWVQPKKSCMKPPSTK